MPRQSIRKRVGSMLQKAFPVSGAGDSNGMWRALFQPTSQRPSESFEGWVYACIKAISNTASNVDLMLYQQNGKDYMPLQKHRAIDLLEKPNTFQNQYEFAKVVYSYAALYGEAFIYKQYNESGVLVGLFPWIDPKMMTVVPGKEVFIDSYVYQPNGSGERLVFQPKEIIHIKNPNPNNPYRGYSPIDAISVEIATDKEARFFNFNFFKNGAFTSGILSTDQELTPAAAARLKKDFDQKYAGTENAHKTIILEQGLQYTGGSTHTDMSFIDQRNWNRDMVLAVFGVPKTAIALVEDVNYSNGENANAQFLEQTIEPWVKQYIGALNEQLLDVDFKNENIFFDYEDLTPETQTTRLERYKGLTSIGAMSINEVRSDEGLPPVNGGDALFIPFNVQEIATTDGKKQYVPKNMMRRRRTHADFIEKSTAEYMESEKGKTLEKAVGDLVQKTTESKKKA